MVSHNSIPVHSTYTCTYVHMYVHVYVRMYSHPWNPQTRTTTETVLREAMQALVSVQAHMLARIVVELRAADLAVELEP
jgi:hypothetical protein